MQLIDNQLLLFGGKGGVGKTSCAAATSIYAASKGKKTLILSTDPAHSLSDSFERQIGNKITKIKDNLDALEIDAPLLMKGYKDKYGSLIKQIADEGTFFSKEDIQEFFNLSLPGMDELMALIKIIDILEENKYDLLIIDTAPTGHTIRLLELPNLMASYVRLLAEMRKKHMVVVSMMVGRYVKDKADEFIDKMHIDIERIKKTLKDKTKTKFIPITIPEAMSFFETKKLINVLEKHQIPIDLILINRVMGDNCNFCKSRKSNQESYINEIKKTFGRYEIKEIPLLINEIKGKNLEILAKCLFEPKFELPKPEIGPVPRIKFEPLKIKPSLEFLLFGGKGGVGKTTMASATALHESKAKKVLIFSTDPAHSLSDSFGVKIGNSITKINENLDALEIDSYEIFNKIKVKYKKEIHNFFASVFKPTAAATIDAPYDRKVMEDLFDLAPTGIDEIMALKTMMDLMQDRKYDIYVLDTAPTGHAIRLLELPEAAEEWINTLLKIQEEYPISFEIGDTLNDMLKTIRNVRNILAVPDISGKDSISAPQKHQNPVKTNFIAVTTPEAMALLETKDLLNSLKKLKVPIEYLIINNIIPKSDCGFCSSKRAEQLNNIKELQKLKLKTVGIGLFDSEIKGQDLNRLSDELFEGRASKLI
jgi:arsenite/tail-anchored protein-transporting ATPase